MIRSKIRGLALFLFLSAGLSSLFSLILNHFSPLIALNWWWGIVFYSAIGIIFSLLYLSRSGTPGFAQLLLVATVIKLLLSLVLIIFLSLIYKKLFLAYGIHVILHFVCFTVFEIRFINLLLRISPLPPNGGIRRS